MKHKSGDYLSPAGGISFISWGESPVFQKSRPRQCMRHLRCRKEPQPAYLIQGLISLPLSPALFLHFITPVLNQSFLPSAFTSTSECCPAHVCTGSCVTWGGAYWSWGGVGCTQAACRCAEAGLKPGAAEQIGR